jgi:hypothetical protein
VDDLLTPEPEDINSRKRYCSTQDALEDEYGGQGGEYDSEPDLRQLSDSIASDRDGAMADSYDRYCQERREEREKRRHRKRARRDRQEMYADYYENEGEPDMYGEVSLGHKPVQQLTPATLRY